MAFEEKPKREDEPQSDDLFAGRGGRMIGAVILIGLGVVFLLDQYGGLELSGNWWVVFLILPVLGMLYKGVRAYQRDGGFSKAVTDNLTGAVIVGLLAVLLWFNQMQLFVPLLLIALGVIIFLGWREPRHERRVPQ